MIRKVLLTSALFIMPCNFAAARNIVISNDDGLTSNAVALYKALKRQGHDVIVSVPCRNQSGMGTALEIFRPLSPIKADCRSDAARAGSAGAGAMSRQGLPLRDFFYVDSTPGMALLYGLDVVAQRRWGRPPDLVLSGPNEGQNVGRMTIGSGTVSIVQYAALRGIPAIALSAGVNSVDDRNLDNPVSAAVADRAVELLAQLERKSQGGAILPIGLVLNVNFPDDVSKAKWRVTRIGSYSGYNIRFAENPSASASPGEAKLAREVGIALPALPGILLSMNEEGAGAGEEQDEGVAYKSDIAVTPMQAGYEAGQGSAALVSWLLGDTLLER